MARFYSKRGLSEDLDLIEFEKVHPICIYADCSICDNCIEVKSFFSDLSISFCINEKIFKECEVKSSAQIHTN